MLVLSRQLDESIIISDNIVVTVVDIRGDKVRLGVQAPQEIPVHRREVYDAIQRENAQAGAVPAGLPTSGPPKGRGGMLVLSRKKNESIVIDNDITIVVVEIRGDKVRLGVEAPKEIPVHWKEVFDAIRRKPCEVQQALASADVTVALDECTVALEQSAYSVDQAVLLLLSQKRPT